MPRREKIRAWNASVTLDDQGPADGGAVLFLHSEEGPQAAAPVIAALAASRRVLAPQHPGFDRAGRIRGIDRPHEIAYLYLDLLDQLEVDACALVGSSFGAWIGMEMAAMQPRRFPRLALLGPVGVKVGGRLDRDFAEALVAAPDVIRKSQYHDAGRDPWAERTDPDGHVERAEQREAFLHYVWEPYLHNPKLPALLPRITAPVLIVHGAQDEFVSRDYYTRLAGHFAAAEPCAADEAGHFPEIERPGLVADVLDDFLSRKS